MCCNLWISRGVVSEVLILAVTGYLCHEPWTAEGGTRGRAKVSGGKPGIVLPGLHKQHKNMKEALILRASWHLKTGSHKMHKANASKERGKVCQQRTRRTKTFRDTPIK